MRSRYIVVLFGILLLAGCGGGTGGTGGGNPPPSQGLIDPSGNWTWVATDSGGNQFGVSGVLFLSNTNTSSMVIANNLKPMVLPIGSVNGSAPPQYSCGQAYYSTPGSLQLASGLVRNDNNLIGEISFPDGLGEFALSATLATDGKSFTGTYTNMPGCVGIGASGTITGTQLASESGTWPGHLQPCTPLGEECSPVQGSLAEPMNFSLLQDNATGTVSGSYVGASLYVDLQAGAIGSAQSGPVPTDYISGYSIQFPLTDNVSGFTGIVKGNLLLSSTQSFGGVITLACTTPSACPANFNYILTLAH